MSGLKKQKKVNYDISVVRLILMLQTLANKDVGQPDVFRFVLLTLPYYTIQTICQHGNNRFQRLCKNILDKKPWLYKVKYHQDNIRLFPILVNANSIIDVSSTHRYTMFITGTGDLYEVGNCNKSYLDKSIFIYKNVKQVSCGESHTAFITNNGDLYGIGNGCNGRLGDGDYSPHSVSKPHKVYNNVKQVSCGYITTMFVTNNGCIYGMGNGNYGKLGDGDLTNHDVTIPTKIVGFNNVKQVSCGTYYAMFVTQDGYVYGMGNGSHNSLHYYVNRSISIPHKMTKCKNVKEIACGETRTLFITNTDDLYCIYHMHIWEHISGNHVLIAPKFVFKNVKQILCVDRCVMCVCYNDCVYSLVETGLHRTNFKNVKQISCKSKGLDMIITK